VVIVSKQKWLGLGLAGLVGIGMACQQSRVAEHWGEAQRENVARMVQNPEAEFAPANPVEGLDPLSGEAVIGKYGREQAEAKEPGQLPSIIELSTGSR
jgi:hypothetical protein